MFYIYQLSMLYIHKFLLSFLCLYDMYLTMKHLQTTHDISSKLIILHVTTQRKLIFIF